MAAFDAADSNLPPRILVWAPQSSGDTARIWKYVCPVDSHFVACTRQLASLKCPRHQTTLTGEAAVTVGTTS